MPHSFPSRVSRVPLCSAAIGLVFVCAGCNQQIIPVPVIPAVAPVSVAGNWQISSTDAAAARLPMLSGSLAGSGSHITGVVHSDAATACVSPATTIALTGSTNAANQITLTADGVAGGKLTIAGTLAANGQSISGATYTVQGGSCAFPAAATATANSFSSINGSYTGTFADGDGQVLAISASLSQTPASDPSGNFQLSGTATLGTNPCFTSPATVSNSQVTGGSFTLTYSDPNLANTVTASGTFSMDGSTLTVTSWTLSGACGNDSGTGQLTRH